MMSGVLKMEVVLGDQKYANETGKRRGENSQITQMQTCKLIWLLLHI